MSDSTGRGGADDLERTAERARELADAAADSRDLARREAAHADDRVDADYGFRVPGAIRRADAVRAGDDLATAERQERVASAQGAAAESLRRNAERIHATAEQIRETRARMRDAARDVEETAEDVRASRAETREVHHDVRTTPPSAREDER